MDYNLERFKSAQAYDFDKALLEIRSGRKSGHWMWYIFPQMRGLGYSSMANYYGIGCSDEARAYLADPVLGSRLVLICEALMELENKDAFMIFGYPDVQKLRSCMTLFAAISEDDSIFQKVLEAYYHGEKDERTLDLLKIDICE